MDLQDIIHTTLSDDNKVNFKTLFLCVPIFNPDAQNKDDVQFFFFFNRKSSTLSFTPWGMGRKTVDTQLEYQVDIVSAQINKSPEYLIFNSSSSNSC